MKIALDPYMLRTLPMDDMVRTVAELGYEYIELSPRDDFMPFFPHPRADDERVAALKKSLRTHGVQLSSVLPLRLRLGGTRPRILRVHARPHHQRTRRMMPGRAPSGPA
ncbi:hypothetical protein GCM10023083_89330 [Streptomyces phyllanthi]